ncbi:MAG TPA: alkaline phosphatase D family protein [Methylomirabilota bacterium]
MGGTDLSLSRRRLLSGALALGASSAAAPLVRRAAAQPRFTGSPFTLGVASGYPLPGGVVLWTRLAPAPLQPGGGMPPQVVQVDWEIATDERMQRVVQRGTAAATPEWAHAVHVEVDGLAPARWYWYRFRAGGEASPIGRTRTAPAAGAAVERFRFAFASCQQYEQGYYGAHHRMTADDLDLVVFLGDYIYESSWGRDHVRAHGTPVPHTLDDYRVRHALYKTDPELQAAHAAYPWIVTWDDHEVENDYADDRSQFAHPREWFLARRAAAYKAYYEHMPLRRHMVPYGPHLRLYHRIAFGSLVQFQLLDDRQFRSHQPCVPAGRGGGSTVDDDCAARLDPGLSLLGEVQERWLERTLDRSRARWNVIGQQSIMAQIDRKPGAGRRYWTDSWDGYPAARRRLLDFLARRRPANPVVIGGDVHSFWVNDLKPDSDDGASPVVATEFVGTSITSQFDRPQVLDALRGDNPHVRFADATRRGYVRVEVTPQQLRADLRAMRTVTQPRGECDTLASFVVADGRSGAVRA